MKANELFFKVRKIEIEKGVERIGVLIPLFEDDTKHWFNPSVSFSNSKVIALLNDGTNMTISIDSKNLKTTRIMDKAVKESLDSIIEIAKARYEVQKKVISDFEAYKSSLKQLEEIEAKTRTKLKAKQDDMCKGIGLLSYENFLKEVNEKIRASKNKGFSNKLKEYSIKIKDTGSFVDNITLENEVDLGHWLDSSSYDFIYLEYDDNVCIYDEDDSLQKSKDFIKIKEKNFFKLKSNKVLNYELKNVYDAHGGGDKRSACATHKVTLNFPKKIEKTLKNVDVIANVIIKLYENTI